MMRGPGQAVTPALRDLPMPRPHEQIAESGLERDSATWQASPPPAPVTERRRCVGRRALVRPLGAALARGRCGQLHCTVKCVSGGLPAPWIVSLLLCDQPNLMRPRVTLRTEIQPQPWLPLWPGAIPRTACKTDS